MKAEPSARGGEGVGAATPVARIERTLPSRLEGEIARITGVRSARVIAEGDSLREIHLVTGTSRPAKQLVRDVQSLASAGFGLSIDHRIVSVVQLDDDDTPDTARRHRRPLLERIVFSQETQTVAVQVVLAWPDGTSTEGTGTAGPTRDARARAAAHAVREAVEPMLKRASVDVEQVLIQRIGVRESVTVQAVYVENAVETYLVGSAIIHDDVASAAARATLQALNRKLY